jgi:alginate O-acetyltransferase complex protein AlgJ
VAALLLAGLAVGWTGARRLDLGADSSRAWLSGKVGKKLDAALTLPHRPALETADAAWRYRFFGQLGNEVNEACPGWLFFRDGLQAPPGADAAMASHLQLLQRYAERLRSQGVALLVVTVPDKSRVETEALCGLRRDGQADARLAQWQAALARLNVPSVDLREPLALARPAFYRTDVHMNTSGAAAAAAAVSAEAVRLLGGMGTLRYQAGPATPPAERMGDLLVLAGLDDAPAGWRPAPDIDTTQVIKPLSRGGLLDDTPPVEVLLAGSSNSRRSNFAEHIAAGLARPVSNISRDGGKFSDALAQGLKDRQAWPPGIKLVIWELSEMALAQGLSEQEQAVLAAMGSTGASLASLARPGEK